MSETLVTSSDRWPPGWCPVEHAIGLLDGRWTVLILREMFREGPRRFRQLQVALGDLSPRTLTDRLARLQAAELVQKISVDGHVHPAYTLTDRGESLTSIFVAMVAWSERDAGHGEA